MRGRSAESKTTASLWPDSSATLSPQGDAVILFAVNSSREELSRPPDFSAFGTLGGELTAWTMADGKKAGEPGVVNGFGEPDRIGSRSRNSRRRGRGFRIGFRRCR
jgi:hypothetical protein